MSDQADKAAEKIKLPVRVEQHKEALGETGDYDFFWLLLDADGKQIAWWVDGDAEEAIANQIRDSLNGSTVTAPRELVDAVKAMILLLERMEIARGKILKAAICENRDEWIAEAKECRKAESMVFDFLNTLRSALSDTKPKVCVHKYTPYDNTWATGCGKVFDDNDSDAGWKFCPYCGSPIKVKE